MKRILIAIVLLFISTDCRAVFISYFPGLDALIERADAIVVLRIDDEIARRDDTLYSTHRCLVHQSLKGAIEPNSSITVRLMDTRTSFVPPFARYSTHLVFLTKKRTPNEATDYRTIEIRGANIRLSPFGNEKMPEGLTTADRIRSLLQTANTYWAEEERMEREFLHLVSSGAKEPNPESSASP